MCSQGRRVQAAKAAGAAGGWASGHADPFAAGVVADDSQVCTCGSLAGPAGNPAGGGRPQRREWRPRGAFPHEKEPVKFSVVKTGRSCTKVWWRFREEKEGEED